MLRYSLRTLFVGLIVVAALLAVWCNSARQQQQAVQAIKTRGGVVMYDYQWSANRDYTCGTGYLPSGKPKAPQRLVDWLGIDMFATVIWVWLPRETTDRDLQPLTELPALEFVCLNESQVSDEGLRCLQGASSLQHVVAFDTRITAEGAAQLERLCPGCTVYYGSFDELLSAMGD